MQKSKMESFAQKKQNTQKRKTTAKIQSTPRAPKKPKTFRNHDDVRVDDYFWLRDRNDPDTMKYIEAENAYFQQQLKPLKPFSDKLFKEMKSRIQEDEQTAPAKWGKYHYYTRFKKGLQYPILCRKLGKSKEEVILDQNKIAKDKKYFHTNGVTISSDQSLMAYSSDFDGSEKYNLQIKNLNTGKTLSDIITNSSGSCAWAKDNQHLFYVELDANIRPFRVKMHILGENSKNDLVVFEEKDPKFFVSVDLSASGEYILIHTSGKVSSEVWVLRSDSATGSFHLFQERMENLEYNVDHGDGKFYIHTNWKAENFQVMTCEEKNTNRKNWKTLIAHDPKFLISRVECFKNHLVVSERFKGLPQLLVVQLAPFKKHLIKFKDEAYQVSSMGSYEFNSDTVRYSYSSPVQPMTVVDYNMKSKTGVVRKVTKVKGFKASHYKCKRVFVSSHDDAKVPLVLLMKKDVQQKTNAPVHLYGYGSYGQVLPDGFRRDIISLVDRGFVVAMAHIRGGQEMGRAWYEDGKFLKKKNTFKDFIACAEYLVKAKWTTPKKISIVGGSAGGMLVGACANMRPDLFGLVVAHVPFVDVINTMLDHDLPLTQIEFKEWGNPADKKYYKYMKSYSPYDNVTKKHYPGFYVTAGLNDPRVTYWEPAKWVAKLRELKKDENQIVFKINMGAGHFGASGRFEYLHETAEEYAYICNAMGIQK